MYSYKLNDFTHDGEKMLIHTSMIQTKGQLPEHSHEDFIEIFYVIKGKGIHILNGIRSEIQRGDLVFLAIASTHTLEAVTDDFQWVDIIFTPDVLSNAINRYNVEDVLKCSVLRHCRQQGQKTDKDIVLNNVEDEFENLIYEVLKEYTMQKSGCEQNLRSYLMILITKIFRCCNENELEKNVKDNRLVNLVVEELAKEKYNINLEKVAKRAFMGYKYFSRTFKESVGIGFTEFVQQKRIEKACELFTFYDLPVSAVAEKTGFTNNKTFYRAFCKYTGMSPSQFKKTSRGEK